MEKEKGMSKFSGIYWKIQGNKVTNFYAKFLKEAKRIAIAIVIFQFMLAGGYWYIVDKGWNDYFGKKDPVVIQIASAKMSAEAPELPQIAVNPEDDIIDTIYIKEGSNAKNNYSKCAAVGKVNRIGYGIPGNGVYQCFDSPREELETLRTWVKDKLSKGMSEKEILCFYNTGNKVSNCDYLN